MLAPVLLTVCSADQLVITDHQHLYCIQSAPQERCNPRLCVSAAFKGSSTPKHAGHQMTSAVHRPWIWAARLLTQKSVVFSSLCFLQILEVIYLVWRGRYLYPVGLVILSLPATLLQVMTLHSQHSRVMALMNEVRLTPMVQQQWVRATASFRLVPGDVIVLQRGRALCDMVVLRGACLVMESMLSGEVGHSNTMCTVTRH